MTNKPEVHRTTPPDFLTVEEAAAVLRIGRSLTVVTKSTFAAGVGGKSDDEQA